MKKDIFPIPWRGIVISNMNQFIQIVYRIMLAFSWPNRSAIKYAAEQQKKKTIICTNSLSDDKAIGTNHQVNLVYLTEPTYKIIILWIPSYIAIVSNEAADKALSGSLLHMKSLMIQLSPGQSLTFL